MTSSGVEQDQYEDTRQCGVESAEGVACDFDGEVVIDYDPEIFTEWWDCPLCGYEHESGYEDQ